LAVKTSGGIDSSPPDASGERCGPSFFPQVQNRHPDQHECFHAWRTWVADRDASFAAGSPSALRFGLQHLCADAADITDAE